MITLNKDDFYLFQDILKRNYFNDFKIGKKNIEFLLSSNTFSLSTCSNCQTIASELYPNQEIFTPTETNKYTNLLSLIDWYITNEFICNIEFNGRIEDENKEEFLSVLKAVINKFLNTPKCKKPDHIIFHTQMKDIDLINNILIIFNQTQIQPIFYIHLNGYYLKDNLYDENYYSQIFDLTKGKNNFYYKVDITPINISEQIKNYKWWILNLGWDNFIQQMYFEEILNNEWDYESIQEYLNFLDFQIDFLSENLINFNSLIFDNISNGYNKPIITSIVDQEILTNKKYYQNCNFHNSLTIDLNTLKIPACCKLNYPIYHIGEFVYEDNNFIIKPINLAMTIPKAHLKRSSTPHCEYCTYLNICEKTCYGENFKVSYNPLCPIKESCSLLQCKYRFLIYKYRNMNLLNLDDYTLNEAFKNDLIQILLRISKEEQHDFST